jgi:hypothetical protein
MMTLAADYILEKIAITHFTTLYSPIHYSCHYCPVPLQSLGPQSKGRTQNECRVGRDKKQKDWKKLHKDSFIICILLYLLLLE